MKELIARAAAREGVINGARDDLTANMTHLQPDHTAANLNSQSGPSIQDTNGIGHD